MWIFLNSIDRPKYDICCKWTQIVRVTETIINDFKMFFSTETKCQNKNVQAIIIYQKHKSETVSIWNWILKYK